MVQRVSTVAFEGIEARSVAVQVQVVPGLPAFAIVVPLASPSAPVRWGNYFFAYLAPDGDLNYLWAVDRRHR